MGEKERRKQGEEGRCWNAFLQEIPLDVCERMPTAVRLEATDGGTWNVHARYGGEEVLRAEGLGYPEAAELVMDIFSNLLEENLSAAKPHSERPST